MLHQKTILSCHTCLPPACEAAFPETAGGLGCVADIPKSQVTLETRHQVVFVFVPWVHERFWFLVFLTWAQRSPTHCWVLLARLSDEWVKGIVEIFGGFCWSLHRDVKLLVWATCCWALRTPEIYCLFCCSLESFSESLLFRMYSKPLDAPCL